MRAKGLGAFRRQGTCQLADLETHTQSSAANNLHSTTLFSPFTPSGLQARARHANRQPISIVVHPPGVTTHTLVIDQAPWVEHVALSSSTTVAFIRRPLDPSNSLRTACDWAKEQQGCHWQEIAYQTRHHLGTTMGFLQDMTRRLPTSKDSLDKLDDLPRRAEKNSPRLSFFRRRIRLKGSSSVSIPLGLVLLFPCLVIIIIIILFVKSPDSQGIMNMPAGGPPSIRYVKSHHHSIQTTSNNAQTDKREVR